MKKAIALTGRGSEEDIQQGAASGFDHYLIKLVDFHELRTLLAAK